MTKKGRNCGLLVGFKERPAFEFPQFPAEGPKLNSILAKDAPEKYTLTDRENCAFVGARRCLNLLHGFSSAMAVDCIRAHAGRRIAVCRHARGPGVCGRSPGV
jgi:hypothetical protein